MPIAFEEVCEGCLTVARLVFRLGKEAVGLGIGPVLASFLVVGQVQTANELGPFAEARDPIFAIAVRSSRGEECQQAGKPIRPDEVEQMDVVHTSAGRVLAPIGIVHDAESMSFRALTRAGEPFDPASVGAIDDLTAGITLPLLQRL